MDDGGRDGKEGRLTLNIGSNLLSLDIDLTSMCPRNLWPILVPVRSSFSLNLCQFV